MNKKKLNRIYPWILAVGASIGLLAAFVLTMEKIALLSDPGHQLSCSLNPVISCGSVILSDQASAFAFPNPLIGIGAFSALLTIGIAILAGASFKSWFWKGVQAGTIFGIGFVAWLIYQSLYSIGALCLYCMAVWSITWPIFWYTTLYNFREGH
ncbi:vitamin K epoxide reductase family protein, partial [Candidatus Saccharibacteria bacterium]|nr:vitamin K epoxide reductase family protein [Candidatus Saccharibacteria bacterium]